VRALIAAVALLFGSCSSQVAVAQLQRITAELTPLVESDAALGSPVRAALQVRIPERFHVQSDAPRDPTLIPTVLTVDEPAGVQVAEIVFPTATEFEQIGQSQPLLVFEHEFTIGVQFDVADTVPTGRMEVPGRLRYQACDDRLCYPPVTTDVRWTLNVVKGGADRQAAHSDVFATIAFGTGRAPGEAPVAAPVRPVTIGDGGLALLDDFTIAASTGGYNGTDDFLQFIQNAEAGVKERGLFEGRGPLAILLLVLLGGLALNLTPCVLPMIPINLAIIGAGAGNGSRARGFLLGGAYGGAMALVYGLLGVIVILTAGTFGTINASPWFNLAIAAVFVALALAMFDVFEIDLSRFSGSIGADTSKRGSFAVAFVMGAVAALLAGACVAPVVIQVVVFSSDMYARGTVAALALPFLLGVGMAVPWPLAGAGLTALPKPGAWMVRVKQAFGVIILATATYYGYLAYGLFADRWVDAREVASSVEEKLKAGWHASLAEGLAAAQREQKPVLVDMWATWCKNCLVMDQTTLADSSVESALDGYVKIKLQAEQPDEEPARSIMARFEAVGLPTYVILHPKTAPSAATPTP
jgi:thioredoxin:protein disulfide reductase